MTWLPQQPARAAFSALPLRQTEPATPAPVHAAWARVAAEMPAALADAVSVLLAEDGGYLAPMPAQAG